ncbi:MAG: phosphoribosylamine--glycine ligase [Candidatus Aerophobetes bacterium]
MKVLVIGSGGREHALCCKLSQSRILEKLYAVPGNAGIARIAECISLDYERNFSSLADFVRKERIDFTIVGPEVPLINGIVDYFEKRGLFVFGPCKKAACLEGSKVFAKRFMKKYGIPTADFQVFSDSEKAVEYIEKKEKSVVVKADGLAGGKGALVTSSKQEAVDAVKLIMEKRAFGDSGKSVVIEDRLSGREISFFAITDGKSVKPLVSSQDHKAIYDGDTGPNTGGMGAYSPAPIHPSLYKKIMRRIVLPTLNGMEKEKRTYRGVLYVGLMIEDEQPKVLEFNVRFGDPETQVTFPRLRNDLLEVLFAVQGGTLDRINLEWFSRAAVCVVLASGGYPDKYETGKQIKGLENLAGVKGIFPFCAGVRKEGDRLLTDGGRVLGITATGKNLRRAIRKAYQVAEKIQFEGLYYRTDIGFKGLRP